MCGIIGINAEHDVVDLAVAALQRVEYRGYDSSGIAVLNGHIERLRREGKLVNLEEALLHNRLSGNLVIGHTRWATHGKPTAENAHPHMSHDSVVVVHNGIIENFKQLRGELKEMGYECKTETDSEVVPHLIHSYLKDAPHGGDLLWAVQKACRRLVGAYALVICSIKHPNRMIGVRKGPPLVVGYGVGMNLLASDKIALGADVPEMSYLWDGDIADVGLHSVEIYDSTGLLVERPRIAVDPADTRPDKAPYAHYMLKEINDQPKALIDTIESVLQKGVDPSIFGGTWEQFAQVESVLMIACGTSSYSGRSAGRWIEEIADIPAHSEIASEYRDRKIAKINPRQLIVTISQSGETADTLGALKNAKSLGHELTLSICNVRDSSLPRESNLVFYTRAGVEISVASTKAFTTQLAALFILALVLAKAKGRLSAASEEHYLQMLRRIPGSVQLALNLDPQIQLWAKEFVGKEHALFLGRGDMHPVALEGALKLKEVSYIHAEAYPAGELKHGPIALIDENMPVVFIAPDDKLFSKLESYMQEVRARGGQLYVFTDEGSTFEGGDGIRVMRLPRHPSMLSSIMHAIPVQLLAYHIARLLGHPIDQPRNLAKSVTVE